MENLTIILKVVWILVGVTAIGTTLGSAFFGYKFYKQMGCLDSKEKEEA